MICLQHSHFIIYFEAKRKENLVVAMHWLVSPISLSHTHTLVLILMVYVSRCTEMSALFALKTDPDRTVPLDGIQLVILSAHNFPFPIRNAVWFPLSGAKSSSCGFLLWWGSKTQLSGCDCPCLSVGRHRVIMPRSQPHRHHPHSVPGFQAAPLGAVHANYCGSCYWHLTACDEVSTWNSALRNQASA